MLHALQFKVYVGIELFIWFPGLYVSCLWFQPTVRIMGTQLGKRGVQVASDALLRWSPSWHASVAKLGANVYGGTHKRAFAEWVLLNKVLAPVSFPTKLWVAHKVVESRKAHTVSLASGASPSEAAVAAVSEAVSPGSQQTEMPGEGTSGAPGAEVSVQAAAEH